MHNKEQGSVVVYVILVMFIMMTSAAIVLSGVLSKHIRSAQDYLSSERSFAAANSGVEQLLYSVARSNNDVTADGSIDYDGQQATYKGSGKGVVGSSGTVPCIVSSGQYRDVIRRLALGEGVPGCDL